MQRKDEGAGEGSARKRENGLRGKKCQGSEGKDEAIQRGDERGTMREEIGGRQKIEREKRQAVNETV